LKVRNDQKFLLKDYLLAEKSYIMKKIIPLIQTAKGWCT